jgi:hypothetical protein
MLRVCCVRRWREVVLGSSEADCSGSGVGGISDLSLCIG